MTEQWLVFTDRETGRELAAYTVRGTFPGERAETVKLLAHDNGIAPERITTTLERRQSGSRPAGSTGSKAPRPHAPGFMRSIWGPWQSGPSALTVET